MYNANNFVIVLNEIINEKINLRRRIFNQLPDIPEEILSILVDKIDISKNYILRFIDSPHDFKYYIKEKETVDYMPILMYDETTGNYQKKNEEIYVLNNKELTPGVYIRHMDNIIENISGNFNAMENYLLMKVIKTENGVIVNQKVGNNIVTDVVEYCVYVPNILKF